MKQDVVSFDVPNDGVSIFSNFFIEQWNRNDSSMIIIAVSQDTRIMMTKELKIADKITGNGCLNLVMNVTLISHVLPFTCLVL